MKCGDMESFTKNHVSPSLPTVEQMLEDLNQIFSSDNYQPKGQKETFDTFIQKHDQLAECSATLSALKESLDDLNEELYSKTSEMKKKVKCST